MRDTTPMGSPLSSPPPPGVAKPISCLVLLALTLFSILPIFFLIGPAVTAFLGYAWRPHLGWRYLVWLGIVCMVLHMAFFAFMLAMPTWYPQLQHMFPSLPAAGSQ